MAYKKDYRKDLSLLPRRKTLEIDSRECARGK